MLQVVNEKIRAQLAGNAVAEVETAAPVKKTLASASVNKPQAAAAEGMHVCMCMCACMYVRVFSLC